MLVGNMDKPNIPIEIIDGQQRITTITIFLSVLSNVLYNYDDKLSTLLWKYIIAQDNDGNFYNVLENESASPYFQKKIQKRTINPELDKKNDTFPRVDITDIRNIEKKLSMEGQLIKKAYDFFKEKLEDENLSAPIFKNSTLSKIEKLKLVRDQLLRSTFVYIISESVNDVNIIFENINSKGLKLSGLDLIKNEIFSVQNETVPIDEAKLIWLNIRKNLGNNGEYISVQKFYRYFWLSRFSNCTEKKLYESFKKKIEKNKYMEFLKDLEIASKNYSQLIHPDIEYFRITPKGDTVSKVDLEQFINSLRVLQDTLNIEQVQVLLITLIDRYRLGLISFKNMKKMVKFLEEFHFIYNGIMTERTNTLVNKYGSTARKIYKLEDQNQIIVEFNKLKKEFIELLPKDNQKFLSKFIQMNYSSKTKEMDKSQKRKNSITKFAIYKLEEKLSERNGKFFDTISATVEHIVPESRNKNRMEILNIGNLIILEKNLNEKCKNGDFEEKILQYKNSTYSSVKIFLEKYSSEEDFDIQERAKEIGMMLYEYITRSW